jgi:carboxypeptidase A4
MYLTFHSYGQYVLYGWGYDKIDAPNVDQLRTMGNVAAEAMRIENGGSSYSVGGAAKLLYAASGDIIILRCVLKLEIT